MNHKYIFVNISDNITTKNQKHFLKPVKKLNNIYAKIDFVSIVSLLQLPKHQHVSLVQPVLRHTNTDRRARLTLRFLFAGSTKRNRWFRSGPAGWARSDWPSTGTRTFRFSRGRYGQKAAPTTRASSCR